MTPRRRFIDACLDFAAFAKPAHLESMAATMESLTCRMADGAPPPRTDGNVVAFPGVDLEAACRAQRRNRRRVVQPECSGN